MWHNFNKPSMLFKPNRLFIDKVYIYECQVFNQ